MEEVYQGLNDLGYVELVSEEDFADAVKDGAKSIKFTALVSWISKELQILYSLEDHINETTSPDDSSSFLLELSSFLKEIGCQYSSLMESNVNDRLATESNKILLLDYLSNELKSARMMKANKPDTTLQLTLDETSTAHDLKNMLQVLNFPKPPANIPPKVLFSKVEAKLKEVVSKVPKTLYNEPLFVDKLSDKQWHTLENFYKELLLEYQIRKELLLKRLDVTIQSFEWSDRLKSKSSEIYSAFRQIREKLTVAPKVRLSDVLAARKDLSIIEKTSSASVRRKTRSDVNKVVIGAVPDRGGRPYEQEPPPPEMPSWQQRSNVGNARGGGRGNFNNPGGRGGGQSDRGNFDSNRGRGGPPRGGRVQAGWNAHSDNYSRQETGNYSQYQGNTRDYRSNSDYSSGGRGQRHNYDEDSRQPRQNYYQDNRNQWDSSNQRSNYHRY